jgi:hypothetical protein
VSFERHTTPVISLRTDAWCRLTLELSRAELREVLAILNLGTLGRNDTSATPMSDLFRGGIP